MSEVAFANFLSSVTHLRVASVTSASALFLYDWAVHFHLELNYMWQGPSSPPTLQILYVVQRYLPFLDIALLRYLFYNQVFNTTDPESCRTTILLSGWSSITGIVISEIALGFRLRAVWWGRKNFTAVLVVFFLLCWVPAYIFFGKFLDGYRFGPPPPGLNNNRGCFVIGGNHLLFISWLLMMVYDTGTFVMMLIPGIKAYRHGGRSELLRVIYQDGVVYYALTSLASLINVIVILIVPVIASLNSLERVLHSIFTSHAILHIRMTVAAERKKVPKVLTDTHWRDDDSLRSCNACIERRV
ncbi:hypothetical protein PM082_014918 [Marasmius tenuissimus]|nr:hypothetical protein PM082_014918 [Marasmius tenuissimus]